jgi:AcrR family transcriptional regulator
LDFYLLNGIDNQSFNNVIKYAGVSKGTIYRLYGSEDALQKAVLVEYYNSFIKERLLKFKSKRESLKKIIMDVTSGLISNRYKVCLYHRSRIEKYKLGKETRSYLSKIETKIEDAYNIITKYQLSLNNRKYDEAEVSNLVNFLLNGITTLNLLKLNKNSHKIILGYANTLIKTVGI